MDDWKIDNRAKIARLVEQNDVAQNLHKVVLQSGEAVKPLSKLLEHYLDKTTLLYGVTGTGKSTILGELMAILNQAIPNIVAVAPTDVANEFYTSKLPSGSIKIITDPKKAMHILRKIILRQKDITQLCAQGKNLKVTKSVFDIPGVASAVDLLKEEKIIEIAAATLAIAEGGSAEERAEKIQMIQTKRDASLLALYRQVIRDKRTFLRSRFADMTNPQIAAVDYLDVNPRLLLIFDDCAQHFKTWKKDPILSELFFMGRQWFISCIVTTQDDKVIESELRKNSMVSIFTSEQAATANFTRASNHYSKDVQAKAREYIRAVFAPLPGGKKNFRKLVYVRDTPDPFSFTVAGIYPGFLWYNPRLWMLNLRIEHGQQREMLAQNPYLHRSRGK